MSVGVSSPPAIENYAGSSNRFTCSAWGRPGLSLTGLVPASFAYDGFGRRTTKTVGGATTAFLYDGLNPLQELVGGSPSAVLLTGLGIDEFLVRTHGAGEEYFLTDALGSTLALADDTGAVETEYTYEPFGAFTTTGSGTSSAFAFTGREADGTGLYYYRARYYDPRLQRFVSEDPLGFAGGSNLFGYVGNRPTVHIDPFGLKPRSPFDDASDADGASDSGGNGGDGPGDGGKGPSPRPPEPPSPRQPDEPNRNCDGFGTRARENFRNTNAYVPGLPGAPPGLAEGLRATDILARTLNIPLARPITLFTPGVAGPTIAGGIGLHVGAFVGTAGAWFAGVAIGSAVDAAVFHPCGFFR